MALSYSAQVHLPGPQPLLGLQRGGAPGRASYTDTRYTPGGTIPIRLLGLPRWPRLEDSGLTAAASTLTQVLRCRAFPPPPLTFSDIHGVTGVPQAAAAALGVAEQTTSWAAVGNAYHAARLVGAIDSSESEWRGYTRVCAIDGTDPVPVTLPKLLACWSERVIGRGLKSSALKSVTSRILSHARLVGSPASPSDESSIWRELPHFCSTFPCEVQPAAPPLGTANGLDEAIAFASARAPAWLFFRVMTALLMVSKSLYCRPTALLRLRRRDISYMPPSASAQGGLVLSLLLPKKRKDRVDLRLDSHPIPMGPTVLALLGLLEALGLLTPEAPLDGAVFPDVDTNTDAIRHPFMTVNRSTDVLRQHVFIPAGIPNGARLTLRSIRSGQARMPQSVACPTRTG